VPLVTAVNARLWPGGHLFCSDIIFIADTARIGDTSTLALLLVMAAR
jgi:hypothetical protein